MQSRQDHAKHGGTPPRRETFLHYFGKQLFIGITFHGRDEGRRTRLCERPRVNAGPNEILDKLFE